MNLLKLRCFFDLNQKEMAQFAQLAQSTYSEYEDGTKPIPEKRLLNLIHNLPPHVLFVSGKGALSLAESLSALDDHALSIDAIVDDVDEFNSALRVPANRIAVIADDKTPYLALIEQALLDSGLQHIPTRGLKINEAGQAEPWND